MIEEPFKFNFMRYLAAKKSVDDRSLNSHVWHTLGHLLPNAPIRVLEVGAGIGTMIERFVKHGLITHGHYTAIDSDMESIFTAISWLKPPPTMQLEIEAVDMFVFAERVQGHQTWDLLVAHAVLDLLDLPTALPALFALLKPGGLFYFTINFDGATIFEPAIDPAFDTLLEQLYHRSMDERQTNGRQSGDSHTGRHLFSQIPAAGGEILAAGGSDWVVLSGPEGYLEDEAYFLHSIIHMMETTLTGHPELDAARFADWIAQRHAQIEARQLVYITHQLDILGRIPVAVNS